MFSPQMRPARAIEPDGRAQTPMPLAQRERGLWSFLTWSFFISQVLAAGSFVGSSAHAAGDADAAAGSTDHASAQGGAGPQHLVAALHANASEETATSAHASSNQILGQHPVDDHSGAAKAITGLPEQVGNHGAGSGTIAHALDVGVDRTVDAGSDVRDIAAEPLTSAADQAEAVIGDVVASLDTILADAAAPVVGAVVGSLEAVADQVVAPLAGMVDAVATSLDTTIDQVAAPLVGTVGEIAGSFAPAIASVTAPPMDAAGALDVVASAGNIVLPELPLIASLHVDDLFSGGSHTPYSLALNAEPSATHPQDAGGSTSIIDAILGEPHGDSGPPDDHHGTQMPGTVVSSALEELHLRGLGDALG
jgi:hypothetical protein